MTPLAFLQCCSCLFCWIRAFNFEMVQIPQIKSLIPLARSCRKILTFSIISLPPKLSNTQRSEKYTQIFHHEGPCSFITTALAPAGPLAHCLPAQFLWAPPHLGTARIRATAPTLNPDYLSFLWKWFSLPVFDLGVGMWPAFDQRDTLENLTLKVSLLSLDIHSLIW